MKEAKSFINSYEVRSNDHKDIKHAPLENHKTSLCKDDLHTDWFGAAAVLPLGTYKCAGRTTPEAPQPRHKLQTQPPF